MLRVNDIDLNKREILELINNGKKLQAIKFIKTKTRIGLKDCKDIVDNLEVNPNYYDGNDFIPVTSFEDEYKKSKRQQSKKGSHIIESNTSNYKNYVILFLLLCVIVLVYMYYSK